ncbi:MAG: SurA N-terminal domain-containing protein, partial [Actinobacteria bacterium]|nr:SurA N-terminal domain-containing protein [Actinomycetota bacterium]
MPVAAAALAAAAAGCGSSVPKGDVAKVGDASITKAQFDHWVAAAARQQASGQPGQPASQAIVPDPPSYTRCIAAKRKAPVPKGASHPSASQLRAQCQQLYNGLRDQTMQFLISAQWLMQEAKLRHVSVSDAQVNQSFEQQKKQAFPKEAQYQAFLQSTGQTEADLLFRVRLSLITNQLQQKIVGAAGNVTPT